MINKILKHLVLSLKKLPKLDTDISWLFSIDVIDQSVHDAAFVGRTLAYNTPEDFIRAEWASLVQILHSSKTGPFNENEIKPSTTIDIVNGIFDLINGTIDDIEFLSIIRKEINDLKKKGEFMKIIDSNLQEKAIFIVGLFSFFIVFFGYIFFRRLKNTLSSDIQTFGKLFGKETWFQKLTQNEDSRLWKFDLESQCHKLKKEDVKKMIADLDGQLGFHRLGVVIGEKCDQAFMNCNESDDVILGIEHDGIIRDNKVVLLAKVNSGPPDIKMLELSSQHEISVNCIKKMKSEGKSKLTAGILNDVILNAKSDEEIQLWIDNFIANDKGKMFARLVEKIGTPYSEITMFAFREPLNKSRAKTKSIQHTGLKRGATILLKASVRVEETDCGKAGNND